MSVDQLERVTTEASAVTQKTDESNKDVSTLNRLAGGEKPEPKEVTSGAGTPSDQKEAAPPADEAKKVQPDKSASVDANEAIRKEIDNHPVLSKLAGKPTERKKTDEADKKQPDKIESTQAKVVPDELPKDPKDQNHAFATLRKNLRDKEREIEESKDYIEFGRGLSEVLQDEGAFEDFKAVDEKQLAGVVKIQAAINRVEQAVTKGETLAEADKSVLAQTIKQLSETAKRAGIPMSFAPRPLTGALPDKWADLVDTGYVSEEHARLFAAMEKGTEKISTSEPEPKAQAKTEEPRRAPVSQPKSNNANPGYSTEEEAVAKNLSLRFLKSQGVNSPADHYRTNLLPILMDELVAGEKPVETFLKLSPMTRHQLIEKAQVSWSEKQKALAKPAGTKPGKAGEQPASPLFRRQNGRGLPSLTNPSEPQRILDHLAGGPKPK
jgi:cytochrome c556